MKTSSLPLPAFPLLRACLVLTAWFYAVCLASAQDYIVNSFDSSESVLNVFNWWAGNPSYSWTNADAENLPASGSLQVTAPFDGSGDQFVCVCPLDTAQASPGSPPCNSISTGMSHRRHDRMEATVIWKSV